MGQALSWIYLATFAAFAAWQANGIVYVYRQVVGLNWPSKRWVWALRAVTFGSLAVLAAILLFAWLQAIHGIAPRWFR